ncbi:MAG: penicillin-binding protein beta-lactamase class [Acidimicrobiales bacterium]|nr:penicillin-binding protein beta-lactamase class [Acidimicrobiales bacterium]
MPTLLPLPEQPDGMPWPTREWPEGDLPGGPGGRLAELLEHPFSAAGTEELGHTHSLLVVHEGRLVADRAGRWFVGELEALAGKVAGPVEPSDRQLSWSMAKSVLHAAVGIAVGDGRVTITDRAPVPAWDDPADPRHAITWDDLLAMRPGLSWVEEYYDFAGDQLPDVVTMLYGDGQHDMAEFAAGFALVHPPGSPEAYCYSSGTSNIISAALQRALELDEKAMRAFLDERLFGPIGMSSADLRFDDAGTFVASSFVYATARDWARFGLLALRGGRWDGTQVLPEGWVDHGRARRSADEGIFHGAHWWDWNDDLGTFGARGFEGQRIMCVPALDLVVVRLGKSHGDLQPALDVHLDAIVDTFR